MYMSELSTGSESREAELTYPARLLPYAKNEPWETLTKPDISSGKVLNPVPESVAEALPMLHTLSVVGERRYNELRDITIWDKIMRSSDDYKWAGLTPEQAKQTYPDQWASTASLTSASNDMSFYGHRKSITPLKVDPILYPERTRLTQDENEEIDYLVQCKRNQRFKDYLPLAVNIIKELPDINILVNNHLPNEAQVVTQENIEPLYEAFIKAIDAGDLLTIVAACMQGSNNYFINKEKLHKYLTSKGSPGNDDRDPKNALLYDIYNDYDQNVSILQFVYIMLLERLNLDQAKIFSPKKAIDFPHILEPYLDE